MERSYVVFSFMELIEMAVCILLLRVSSFFSSAELGYMRLLRANPTGLFTSISLELAGLKPVAL